MTCGDFARSVRTTFDDRHVQLTVLADQHVAGLGALFIHATDVGHDIALEQIKQTPNCVQQHRIMAGFGDCQVKAGIRFTLLGPAYLATRE